MVHWASRGSFPGSPLFVLGCALLFLAGCGGSSTRTPSASWPLFGNTSDNTRFSPLRQIDTATVHSLAPAWSRPEGPHLSLFESNPIVVGNTLYITTNTDQVDALNAVTGAIRWQYTPVLNLFSLQTMDAATPVSRGVTVAGGTVYVLTFDDRLIALRASSGAVRWQRQVADPGQRYVEPSPPTYWNGLLFVGSAGGDNGARGFVAAFNARTGGRIWRYYTVPAAGHGWVPKRGHHGGGDVWMPPTVDVRSGVLYAGTGNPSPDLTNRNRPGCDRWTDATIALDARTGRFLWGHTEVCPDLWDYDSGQPPMLFPVRAGRRTIRAVGEGNKDGIYSIFDASSGRLLSTSVVVPGSRPRPAPTRSGARVCPGEFGGILYSPASYNPLSHRVFVPGLQMCGIYTVGAGAGSGDVGGTIRSVRPYTGTVAALDANSGRAIWKRSFPAPVIGGTLATAGNLVFTGCDNGRLYALDARSGAVLWQWPVGLPFGAAPITYAIGGRQFVAVAAGGSAVAVAEGRPTKGRLLVFALPSHQA